MGYAGHTVRVPLERGGLTWMQEGDHVAGRKAQSEGAGLSGDLVRGSLARGLVF